MRMDRKQWLEMKSMWLMVEMKPEMLNDVSGDGERGCVVGGGDEAAKRRRGWERRVA